MAKGMGLHVTGVCSARNADLARSLGADVIIDYNEQDFCATSQRYDAVLDLVGNRSIRELRTLVQPSGTLVLSGGGVPGAGRLVGPLGLLVRAQLLARLPGPRIAIPQATPTQDGLAELAAWVTSGRMTPILDRIYDLHEAPDAIRYMEREHARAKVVVTIPPQNNNEHLREHPMTTAGSPHDV
jgi:NADPH:quinone reductase-like Zn-dependent oxidoreductase